MPVGPLTMCILLFQRHLLNKSFFDTFCYRLKIVVLYYYIVDFSASQSLLQASRPSVFQYNTGLGMMTLVGVKIDGESIKCRIYIRFAC